MQPRIATVCDLKEQDGGSLARVCLSNRVRYGKVMPGGREKKSYSDQLETQKAQ